MPLNLKDAQQQIFYPGIFQMKNMYACPFLEQHAHRTTPACNTGSCNMHDTAGPQARALRRHGFSGGERADICVYHGCPYWGSVTDPINIRSHKSAE